MAQKGKDQCDRDGAVAKRKIRTYVNEGHDVTDAVSVKEAIDAPPGILENSKSCVIELDYNNMELAKAKSKISVATTTSSLRRMELELGNFKV